MTSLTDLMTSSFPDDDVAMATTPDWLTLLMMLGNSTTSPMTSSRRGGGQRLVNCSGELYELTGARRHEKRAMETFASVIFYVTMSLGLPGNILSALVWLRPRIVRHNSSAVYLGALAVDDLVFLLFFFLTRLFLKMLNTKSWPREIFAVLRNARRAAEMLEPLIVTAFSAERLVAIVRPLQAMRTCTPSRSKKIICVLAVVAVVVPVSQTLFDYVYYGELHRGVTTSRWITIFVFFVVLPLTALVLNAVVIRAARRTATDSELAASRHQSAQPNSAVPTAMLMAVSLVYVVLSSCSTLSYVITRLVRPPEVPSWCAKALRPRWRLSDRVYAITSQLHKLIFAYNFVIYVVTGRLFRQELRALCCRRTGASHRVSNQSRDSAVTAV